MKLLSEKELRELFAGDKMLEGHKTPKHLPPRKDAQEQDMVTDVIEDDGDLDPASGGYESPKEDDFGFNTASVQGRISAKLDIFDVNDFTEADIKEIISAANDLVDPMTLKIDPYLALRVALDYVLWYGPSGLGEASYYNLIGHSMYDDMLSTLADKHGMDLEVLVEPFKLRDDHLYQGLDMIQEARNRVSSVIDQLVMKQDQFKGRIKNLDNYLQRVQKGQDSTEVLKVQMQDSLESINTQLDLEIKKLTNYQEFLKEALLKSVGGIFESELGASPLVKIQFSKLEAAEDTGTWVLAFTTVINEVFDPKRDRRFETSEDGMVNLSDAESVLSEAGKLVKKKLGIIQKSFERFLKAEVSIDSDNRIKGQVEDGLYRAFAEFTFTVSVPVKDDADVKLITLSLGDCIRDLMDADFGRLSARIASSPLMWYPDYGEDEDKEEDDYDNLDAKDLKDD